MNVKCPYCGCSYKIKLDMLKNPIGNERLGYGWWLRCFKCQKKWWLKKSSISIELEKSIKANKSEQIAKISRLSGKRKHFIAKAGSLRVISCVLLCIAILAVMGIFYHKDVFTEYLIDRARRLSKNTRKNITMSDVRYNISKTDDDESAKIFVTGVIKNDDNFVARIQGIKISIFDGKNEIKSWDAPLRCDYIVPKDSLSFSTETTIDKVPDDIRVEVSIF
ncbi:MAG: hypothetical protein LBL32_00185 [Holosporales bacterium]|jgi:hypothetical protein|nr:hypothetical protein [Holosporales bacterium]